MTDFWMTQTDVAEVCPSCAEKMASLNIRQIRASVLFGVDNPEQVVEAVRDRTAATGDKWQKLPKGWTDESRSKMWTSLVGDVKHKVTKCIKKMTGKVDDPGAFCASLADRVEGKGWRSKKKADMDKQARAELVEAAEQLQTAKTAARTMRAFGEKMKSVSEKEFADALAKAKWPSPEYSHTKRTMDAYYKDRGTLVAHKTQILTRGKVSQESFMVNVEFLEDGKTAAKKDKKVEEPKPDQLKALKAYAKWAGKDWKKKLSRDWMRSGSEWDGPWHLMQQLRNQLGPKWLTKYTLK